MAYDDLPMQQLRRIGDATTPTTLLAGQFAYHQTGAAGAGAAPGDLYIGDGSAVKLLVGPSKVWTLANFKLGGASAAGDVLTASNTTGDLVWTTAPPATVSTSDPIHGNGTGGTPVALRINTSQLQIVGAAGSGALTLQLASNAEAMAGTDANKTITPATLRHVTGNLATLDTTDKDTLVEAINEIAGQIQALEGALQFLGTYNAATNQIVTATPPAVTGALPAAAAGNTGWVLICTVAGTPTGTGASLGSMTVGDWAVSNGSSWIRVDLDLHTVAAANVSVTGHGTTMDTVQKALDQILTTGGAAKVGVDGVTIGGDGTTANPLEVLGIDSGTY